MSRREWVQSRRLGVILICSAAYQRGTLAVGFPRYITIQKIIMKGIRIFEKKMLVKIALINFD